MSLELVGQIRCENCGHSYIDHQNTGKCLIQPCAFHCKHFFVINMTFKELYEGGKIALLTTTGRYVQLSDDGKWKKATARSIRVTEKYHEKMQDARTTISNR
jgi:hypothetical protein